MSNATAQTISITEIPSVRRKTSESFAEIDTALRSLKPNQAYCNLIARTKKGELNRQFSIKVAKHLGERYTVVSRMGVEKYKQNPTELYVYVYVTPPQTNGTAKTN